MQLQWQQLIQRYAALSVRERILVGGAILVAIAVIWFMLLIDPAMTASKAARTEAESVQKTLASLQQQYQALQLKQQQDPLRDLKDRIAQLNQHIEQVDAQLTEKLHGLIAPKQMAKVLEAVLQQHHELKLVKLQSLPATPLVTESKSKPDTNDEAKADKAAKAEVYRHGLQLEFEGSYLATLAYLKALQALPWEFYWDEVRLEVEKYPAAKVTIVVHTLSLTEGWIGV